MVFPRHLFILSVLVTVATATFAQQSLTINERHDTQPVLYGKGVAWLQEDGDGYYQVVYYDGKTTRALTIGAQNNSYLVAAGKYLVWTTPIEVKLYDGKTVRTISGTPETQTQPHTDGKWVVWEQAVGGGDREIMLWDGATISQLTSNAVQDSNPRVHGGRVVWTQTSGDDEIMLWENGTTQALTNNATADRYPCIEGNLVAWQGRDGSSQVAVFLYDGNTTRQLSTTPGNATLTVPRISRQCIVWPANNPLGSNQEIFLWQQGVTTQITDNYRDNYEPHNIGNKIVWTHADGHDEEIFFYNGKGVIAQLTNNSQNDNDPHFNGKAAVWVGFDGEDVEIYLFPGKTKLP